MGLFKGIKRAFKSAVKFEKNVFSGKYVRSAVKSGAKFAKKNPELLAAGIGIASGGGFLSGLGGLFGGGQNAPQGNSLVGPEQVGEGVVTDTGFAPPIPKELLYGGAAVLALVLLTRK